MINQASFSGAGREVNQMMVKSSAVVAKREK